MLFAHLKRILRLGRLRFARTRGAQDEFLLAATAQNLRKPAMSLQGNPSRQRPDEIIAHRRSGSRKGFMGSGIRPAPQTPEFFNGICHNRTFTGARAFNKLPAGHRLAHGPGTKRVCHSAAEAFSPAF